LKLTASTLLLTIGLASFLLPNLNLHQDFYSQAVLPHALRGLVGLIFLFDLYTIYQHLLIHRIRKELVEREELFHLISENAADMIAIVDMNGKRIFNRLWYQKVLGYSPEELQASFAFEQIHPDDRECVKNAAEDARRSGIGKTLEYRLRHKNGNWLVLESTSSVTRNVNGEPEKLVIVNRNITECKRTEEALRRSETDFRSVVEHAPNGIYRATITGRFLQFPATALHSRRFHEPSGVRGETPTKLRLCSSAPRQSSSTSATIVTISKPASAHW